MVLSGKVAKKNPEKVFCLVFCQTPLGRTPPPTTWIFPVKKKWPPFFLLKNASIMAETNFTLAKRRLVLFQKQINQFIHNSGLCFSQHFGLSGYLRRLDFSRIFFGYFSLSGCISPAAYIHLFTLFSSTFANTSILALLTLLPICFFSDSTPAHTRCRC